LYEKIDKIYAIKIKEHFNVLSRLDFLSILWTQFSTFTNI
jgi:hypothetical protein